MLLSCTLSQDGTHSGAECKRAQGARAAISLLLEDFKDPFFHVQEFRDKRAADKVDIGLDGIREPTADDRILQCCLHYQVRQRLQSFDMLTLACHIVSL